MNDINALFSLKQYKNKISYLVIIVSVIFIALNIKSRFYASNNTKIKQTTIKNITPLSLPVLTKKTQAKLQKMLNQFDQLEQKSESTAKQLTKEQQNKQQGILQTVFVDDTILRLKAVISKTNVVKGTKLTQFIALIYVENIKTKKSSITQFNNLSDVYGYTLLIEKNTQVTLTKNNSQKIILTMYKVQPKN